MKKYFCDICGKEIQNYDTYYQLEIKINEKPREIEVHSECWRELMETVKEKLCNTL